MTVRLLHSGALNSIYTKKGGELRNSLGRLQRYGGFSHIGWKVGTCFPNVKPGLLFTPALHACYCIYFFLSFISSRCASYFQRCVRWPETRRKRDTLSIDFCGRGRCEERWRGCFPNQSYSRDWAVTFWNSCEACALLLLGESQGAPEVCPMAGKHTSSSLLPFFFKWRKLETRPRSSGGHWRLTSLLFGFFKLANEENRFKNIKPISDGCKVAIANLRFFVLTAIIDRHQWRR